jgi:hypothetical protein
MASQQPPEETSHVGESLDPEDRVALSWLNEFMREIFFRAVDLSAETARWLLASLLVVNGGALVAALASERIPLNALLVGAPFWVMGVLLALGTGLTSFQSGQRGITITADLMNKLTSALYLNKLPELDFTAQEAELKRRTRRILILGVSSAVAFVLGVIATTAVTIYDGRTVSDPVRGLTAEESMALNEAAAILDAEEANSAAGQ